MAVALIKDGSGRYLLIQQKAKNWGDLTDAWYPPGGHVEENESIEECLKRELMEELNLQIRPMREVTVWPQDVQGEVAHWWECELIGGEVKFNDNTIADAKYFSIEEIKHLKKWPAETKFFEKFLY